MKEGILHGLHDEKISNLVRWRSMAAEVIRKVEKTLDVEKTVPEELYDEARDALADLRLAMDSENAFVLAEKIKIAENAGRNLLFQLDHPEIREDDDNDY